MTIRRRSSVSHSAIMTLQQTPGMDDSHQSHHSVSPLSVGSPRDQHQHHNTPNFDAMTRSTNSLDADDRTAITPTCDSHSGEPRWGMRDPLFPAWTKVTLVLHSILGTAVTSFALHAVRNPRTYISVITVLAITLQIAGFLTNFSLVLDLDQVFTPQGSRPLAHANWISDYGFPEETRSVQMIFHADGANVLHVEQTRRVLQAVDVIRTTDGYSDLCRQGVYQNFNDETTCRIISVSSYWKNHSLAAFEEQVGNDDNTELLRYTISGKELADGSPVLHDLIVGNYQRDNATKVLTSAQSYMLQVQLPDKDDTDEFEAALLGNLADLRNDWIRQDSDKPYGDPTILTVDIMTVYAYQLELLRTIISDLYLVPICIFLMVGFTCALFTRVNDRVQSRGMLGLASVVTICMSMFTGNGLMFLFGVPYSAVHQMLPFVIFGIGLDDTFIITGSYFRTDPTTPVADRVEKTMQEVGPSITLTTFTTIFAFGLGYITSSLPGVHWLCLYAMTIILCDFYYQITYFVAFLVLDERRIAANKKDCCFWVTVEPEEKQETDHDDDDKNSDEASEDDSDSRGLDSIDRVKAQNAAAAEPKPEEVPIPVRIMLWYSEFLMKPAVKIAVLVIFSAFFGLCCYSASLMEQDFNVADYVAPDSYLATVFSSLNDYSSVVRPMGIYFRNIDQMDPDVQQQMIKFVDELETLDQIGATNVSLEEAANSDEIRPFCWVRDLQEIEKVYDDPTVQAILKDMTFSEKLDFAMNDKRFREVYGADIVRDEHGNITASRCYLFLKNLDLESVEAQIDMLFDQRAVSMSQPINQMPEHSNEWAMFSFNNLFFYWEAYAVAVDELVLTIFSGVISVTLIAFVFIPHWSAAFFVLPMILVLYINLLGTIRFFGLDINGLTYICVVVAIGLLVDFLMHVLLRYYESRPDQTREARVKETLQTMGVSIMVGGFTTFLGVLPLIFSSVYIFLTVFYAFFAMVVLGVSHGLILLPVVLSYVGPTKCVRGHHLATSPNFQTGLPPSGPSHDKSERPILTGTKDSSVDDSAGSWMKEVTDEIEV